ncbi:MAG TPA: protein TolR [Gammaproteobacteria bacterium]|nr:protein TolR [Gammaproteobacteria bacterium]
MAGGVSRRGKRRLMGEINVVPYIDVMLVLLIIFMVTAPLLTQGVKVELPEAATENLPPEDSDPIVLTVNAEGELFLNIGEDPEAPLDDEFIIAAVSKVLQNRPDAPVMVRGDRNVDYGSIMHAMSLLQQAGAPSIGMVSDPPKRGGR